MGRERDDRGRYSEGVPPERVLDLFDTSEPRTTSEVADALDVAQKTAYNKLVTLQERGEIRKKEIGGLAVVWWRPNPQGRPVLTPLRLPIVQGRNLAREIPTENPQP